MKEGRDNGTIFEGYLRPGGAEDTIVSGTGGDVRAWDAADGRLVWECTTLGKIRGLEVLDIAGLDKDVLVLSQRDDRNLVSRLSSLTGQIVWQFGDERSAS